MPALAVGVALGVGGLGVAPKARGMAEKLADEVSGPKVVSIQAHGAAATQKARYFASTQPAPLIVDLHAWSMDHRGHSGSDVELDRLVRERGWNYIRPALAGPNNTPAACCSAGIIDGVNNAIAYAKAHGQVTEVYIVGGSGGGYTALCSAMSDQVKARAFYAWSSITDLEAWHAAHLQDDYGRDIMQCTASQGSLDLTEARKRSPMYMALPKSSPVIHLYAGVTDGSGATGSVLPAHSMRLYNRFAEASGAEPISDEAMLALIYRRSGSETAKLTTIGDRVVHLRRQAGPVSMTVFQGGHEFLSRPTMAAIEADQAELRSRARPLEAGPTGRMSRSAPPPRS